MKGNRYQGVIFIFWLIIATLSISWITFSLSININLILTDIVYQIIFTASCLGLIISVLVIRNILTDVEYHIDEDNQKQKNIKDYYQYIQLLDPPEMNN